MKQEVTPIDGFHYSTDEQFTGKYWIDGKKIYQKTVVCKALPSSGEVITTLNIVSIDKICYVNGLVFLTDGTNVATLPYAAYTGPDTEPSFYNIYMNVAKTKITLGVNTNAWVGGIPYVTIRYTKTTD